MRVVVLGGYGNFGARISRALAGNKSIDLVIAARQQDRAQAFAASLGGEAVGVGLDINSADLNERLIKLKAELVIHTAGPFQGQHWQVPRAVAEAGAHYIDLADGRRWVCDFSAGLNAAFTQQGRFAVTGASTVPALSSAVIDRLALQFAELESIDICIAPAQQAPRGEATLASVLSYCGEPIRVWRQGAWTSMYGWRSPQKVSFARMLPRRGALCDIPDLELFPSRYVDVKNVMFRAALEVGTTQWIFAGLAALRSLRLMPKLTGLAPFINRTAKLFDRFGTPLGGMVICLRGNDRQGKPRCLAWHLTADYHHGPEIPCMPAIILARKLANGMIPAVGAYPCMDFISIEEFQPEFDRWNMVAEIIEEA